MKKKIKNTIKTFTYFLLFLCIVIVFLDKANFTRKWLRTNMELSDPGILVIESWLTPLYDDTLLYTIHSRNNDILFTGVKSPNHITLFKNGNIIIKDIFKEDNQSLDLEFGLKGSKVLDDFTKINICFNDSVIANNLCIKRNTSYATHLTGSPKDSICLQFINDAIYKYDDRNLMLKSIKANHSNIPLRSKDILLQYENVYVNTSTKSISEQIAKAYISKGVPPERVKFISSSRSGISKTYNSAADAIKWLKENGYKSANIITTDYHSRRTYLSFKKADPDFQIGIISISDRSFRNSIKSKIRMLKELTGCLLIRITPRFILE